MNIPAELLLQVLSYLDSPELAKLSRCSKRYHQIITPILYTNLSVRVASGSLDASSESLLQSLISRSDFRAFVRQVEITSGSYEGWGSNHSKLLSILLSSILTNPKCITSLVWKASGLPIRIFFPELASIECTRVADSTDLLWLKWHLMCCPLKSVRICLSTLASQRAGHWFLSNLQWPHVQHLFLQGADLTRMNSSSLECLDTLDLKFCHGLDDFLAFLISNGVPKSLKVIRITGYVDVTLLERFLVNTTRSLSELSLRIGGASRVLDVRVLAALAPSLSILILDFRRHLDDPRLLAKYTAEDFQAIIRCFPLLKSIGVAMDLRNPKCRRYRRVNLAVSPAFLAIFPAESDKLKQKGLSFQASCLEYLHLRGCSRPLKRSILDAKHLAAVFTDKRHFKVLLDHGKRLKKLEFRQHSYASMEASQMERVSLSTDLR